MNKLEPKYRRPLNIEQIQILESLYKFRFVTVSTLKAYFSESNPGMNVFKRLEVLQQQGFIAKRYFDNYRLLHKPVAHYLLPDGVRKLAECRDEDDRDEINIKGIYRDGRVREPFVMHCLMIFDLYNHLVAKYGYDLNFLSRSDLVALDNFLRPLPDAYVTFETGDGARHFFLEILDDDVHLFIDVSKKIKRYLNYRESGDWTMIDSVFPVVIFVCNSETIVKEVRKRCDAAINKTWIQDIEFKVVTMYAISLV